MFWILSSYQKRDLQMFLSHSVAYLFILLVVSFDAVLWSVFFFCHLCCWRHIQETIALLVHLTPCCCVSASG